MLNVTNKPYMLSAIMLIVIMLSVVMLSIVIIVTELNVILFIVAMLSDIL
jgi:hypothetical protein